MVQCAKSIPECLSNSKSNAQGWASSFIASRTLSSGADLTRTERFELQKTILEQRIKNALCKARNSKMVFTKEYREPAGQQNVFDLITEDNIDLASKLLNENIGYDKSSNYSTFVEQNSEYILKTVPRLLKNKNPNISEAIQLILEHPDLHDKMYALKVLDESNALQMIDILKGDYTLR